MTTLTDRELDQVAAPLTDEILFVRRKLYEFQLAYDRAPEVQDMLREFQKFATRVAFDNDQSFIISLAGDKATLVRALRALAKARYVRQSPPPAAGETSWSSWFHSERYPLIRVFFMFTSTVCKRVKVGTKTVVQDVYETQCGEGDIEVDVPQLSQLGELLPSIEEETGHAG